MAWSTSDRAQRLPPDWWRIRAQVKARARGQCEWVLDNGTRCTQPGTDADHVARGDAHHLANLQWLCHPHHKVKTAAENRDATAQRARLRQRPTESHPGRKT